MPERFWASVPYLDPQHGDHKVIWEFNRHQHWLTLGRAYWLTGNARYADAIVHQLESWLSANPPLTGVNWASMLELGFRSLSWLWAIHILQTRPAGQGVLVDLLVGLDRQMVHVADNALPTPNFRVDLGKSVWRPGAISPPVRGIAALWAQSIHHLLVDPDGRPRALRRAGEF